MKERGAKVLKEKKKQKKKGQDDKKDKPKGLYTRESEAQLMLQAMAFNEKVIKLVHVHCSVIIGRNPIGFYLYIFTVLSCMLFWDIILGKCGTKFVMIFR